MQNQLTGMSGSSNGRNERSFIIGFRLFFFFCYYETRFASSFLLRGRETQAKYYASDITLTRRLVCMSSRTSNNKPKHYSM